MSRIHHCETDCIEVCRGDRLVGYVIHFSGGWDAYVRDGGDSLLLVGVNFLDRKGALRAVTEGADWRKGC